MEIGLLTAIAIRGRPVKGRSLADPHLASERQAVTAQLRYLLSRSGADVLGEMIERAHTDERAGHAR